MALDSIELKTVDGLYNFVESSVARTGLILDPDAPHRPWARAVSSDCPDVKWLYPEEPLPDALLQHLSNFVHGPVSWKGFVLLEHGRALRAIDVDQLQGSNQPHRLAAAVKDAFSPRARAAAEGRHSGEAPPRRGQFIGDPFAVLEAEPGDSDEEIKKKYKQMLLQYHPDRVDHLGPELKELAARKTTEINMAFAAIRKRRGF
jgi:hypothetical protein